MRLFAVLFVLYVVPAIAMGQQAADAKLRFFESKIRPALTKYCYECHSVEAGDSQGGLLVDTRMGLLEGGDAGPALVPGDADASLIWDAITWQGYEMPPSQKMPDDVIANFKAWIEMGAPDPRVREITSFKTKITEEDIEKVRSEHWSFQPPVSQAGDTIDSLVDEEMQASGLEANSRADSYTILRRIYFDLVGLPPSPAEIKRFQSAYETNPNAALNAKIDQLLSTPQYGERWGRHWLDVARYGESSGARNTPFPHAWRYRDYVINAFNKDTPYDRFISEQLAGDLLPAETDEQWTENLVATGFLAIGLKHLDNKNPREFMSEMVDEQIDTTTQAILGLTVACARCHDHKYDPIPTDDYYSLAGIFYSTKTFYGTERIAQNHRPSDLLLLPIQDKSSGGRENRQRIESIKQRIADLDQQLRRAGGGKDRRGIRNNRNRLAAQLASMNPDGSVKSFAMGVQEAEQMVNANILFGGEIEKPAQEVPRGFVRILGDLNFESSAKNSGRLSLARAMTSKSNPLTARVMVNRIWMHLIGKPLVGTPSNFGLNGMRPTNQKLLDHLAVRFMENDWSIKKMIREIMVSETYLRSSAYGQENYASDPDNKLLWRANPRHLDAEAIRDSMLMFSGNLDLEPPKRELTIGTGGRGRGTSVENLNRSVYLPIDRLSVPSSLELFGFPDPNVTSPGRAESIVPIQALYMMNDEFVISQAQSMATALKKHFKSQDEQIRMAILWAYGRPATPAELEASKRFFAEFTSVSTIPSRAAAPARQNRRQSTSSESSLSVKSRFTDEQTSFYEQKVQPILAQNCLNCHGSGRAKGGLSLLGRESLLTGGQSGNPINEEVPQESLLLKVVKSGAMPPSEPLSNQQIAVLTQWVKMKVPYSESTSRQPLGDQMRRGARRQGQRMGQGQGQGIRQRGNSPSAPGAQGMRRQGTGRQQERGPADRIAAGMSGSESRTQPQTPLSVFCQTLMASASFRVLD